MKSVKKQRIPKTQISGRNALVTARTIDGCPFFSSSIFHALELNKFSIFKNFRFNEKIYFFAFNWDHFVFVHHNIISNPIIIQSLVNLSTFRVDCQAFQTDPHQVAQMHRSDVKHLYSFFWKLVLTIRKTAPKSNWQTLVDFSTIFFVPIPFYFTFLSCDH